MLQNKRFYVIKITIGVVMILMAISGISSHYYSIRQRTFRISRVLLVFQLVVLYIFAKIYVQQIVNDYFTNQFNLDNVVLVYSSISIISALINYLTSLVCINKMLKLMKKSALIKLIGFFNISRIHQIKSPALLVLTKTIILPVVIELTLVVRLLTYMPQVSLLWTLYTLFPIIISRAMPSIVFGAVAINNKLINALNEQLQSIFKEVNLMQTEQELRLQKRYYRMQRFCDLSERLDTLSLKYMAMCAQTNDIIEVLSVPFLCALICNLFVITAVIFMQYTALANTFINGEYFDGFNAITNAVFLLVPICEIALQAATCHNYVDSVRKSGQLLQCVRLEQVDVRFRQSVEAFSLIILTSKYKIKPLGLLDINISILRDVLAAITSFLLILIQSDLTMRFSLK